MQLILMIARLVNIVGYGGFTSSPRDARPQFFAAAFFQNETHTQLKLNGLQSNRPKLIKISFALNYSELSVTLNVSSDSLVDCRPSAACQFQRAFYLAWFHSVFACNEK